MRLPFLFRPKPEHAGPHYADLYTRSVAVAIDVSLLFFLLRKLFEDLAGRVFAHVNMALIKDIETSGASVSGILQRLWESHYIQLWLLNSFVQFLVIGVFVVTCQIMLGTTPGRWLVGVKIVHAQTLEPIANWRKLVRYLAYLPAVLPLMIGIFWVGFNSKRRGWHDFIAGTVVLNTRPNGWYYAKLKLGIKWLIAKVRNRH